MYSWPEEDSDEFVKWPTLYFEVYSLDSWQQDRIEGYGYCQLPDVAGSTCFEIDTWRPLGESITDEMNRFFIGSTPQLDDFTCTKDAGIVNENLSKFYFKTNTTGSVKIRVNTMLHTK